MRNNGNNDYTGEPIAPPPRRGRPRRSPEPPPPPGLEGLESIQRLTRDLRTAAITLSDTEARYLVDSYYIMQEDRKRTRAQERALGESAEPHLVISWLAQQSETLEAQIVKALDAYTQGHMMGDYLRGIFGVGPVISAGLLAHLYMGKWCAHPGCRGHNEAECQARQANPKYKLPPHQFNPVWSSPTTGHWWSYAGIAGDGQQPWEKGQKRPWNAELKTILWRLSDVFVKFSNNDKCYYGGIYRERKEKEVHKNDTGQFADKAMEKLKRDLAYERANGRPAKEKVYHAEGKLSPGHLDLRARRYAVKLFLAHLHDEWWRKVTGTEPPLPYPIAHLGHVHLIPPPPPVE